MAVNAGQRQTLTVAGGEYRIIVSGKQTNGSYAVIGMLVPPGAGPVPHVHPDFIESFYILEGAVVFKLESGSFTAQIDAFVAIPTGGEVHCFKNITGEPAKLLCTVIPAGLDEFFIEVSDFMKLIKDAAGEARPEVKEYITQLSVKYGQTLYPADYLD